MKLQKFMSQSWICSRRKAEKYIAEGQVYVNDEIAHIWQIVDSEKDVVIETTCAQKWGSSIIDIIDIKERVFPIGRLDKETTGLILLTNDGRITNFLTHPRYNHEKEYVVEVFWPIEDSALRAMSDGIEILWKLTKKCKVERIAAWKFSIILTEWRNRQIRRMVEAVWHKVKKLKRVRIENIFLKWIAEWEYRHLSTWEKNELFTKIWLENETSEKVT